MSGGKLVRAMLALLWASGDVYWTLVLAKRDVIPVPSLADAGYLALYPLVFAGLCLLLSARVEGAPRTLWVDGLTGALAAGALSAAVVLQTVLDTVGGNALGVATNLAYPIGDLILLSVVIASFALRGWRADRTWTLLGVAIVLFWIADSYYLVTVAKETYTYPSVFDGGWTICLILLSAAAWQRPRRAVAGDLERAVAGDGGPVLLALFDLDGFKHYNDSYGHPAGDALLQRLGAKLAAHVAAIGTAYRMGGDEFCVLLPLGADPDAQADAAALSLTEQGDGFAIGASHGAVSVPAEAREPGEALRIADHRMYANKNSGRASARSQ